MQVIISDERRIFLSFLLFGLINNILYVVILSAAIDLVGSSTPKAVVLLADIVPAFLIKVVAPFVIHLVAYKARLWCLVALSVVGMLIVSTGSGANAGSVGFTVFGICLALASAGLGEITFLLLTHFYNEKYSIGGFSIGKLCVHGNDQHFADLCPLSAHSLCGGAPRFFVCVLRSSSQSDHGEGCRRLREARNYPK